MCRRHSLRHRVRGWNRAGWAAYSFSTAGALIHEWVGDLDEDGSSEVLIGAKYTDHNGLTDAGSAFLYSGSSAAQMHRFDGSVNSMHMGSCVGPLGDWTGDDLNGFIVCAEWDFTTSGHGASTVWAWGTLPYLTTSAEQISSASGGTVDFAIDFLDSESGRNYLLVGSATGTGPTTVNGVDIPPTQDWLSTWMASANPPSVFSGSAGVLEASGNANATLLLPPDLTAGNIGTTFYFAAISLDLPNLLQLSSVAVPLLLNP